MKRHNTIIILMLCLLNGACLTTAPDHLPHNRSESGAAADNATCHDAQALAGSLYAQRLYRRNESGSGFETELFDSLGGEILQHQGFRLISAMRISGECVGHLDAVDSMMFHFDTDITIALDDEGTFAPYTKQYRQRFIVNPSEKHPERFGYDFVKAVEAGFGFVEHRNRMTHFIGEWSNNETFILTPYRVDTHGNFHIYDDLIALHNKILLINYIPHPDTPSGTIQIAVRDGDERILLAFTWWQHKDFFTREPD